MEKSRAWSRTRRPWEDDEGSPTRTVADDMSSAFEAAGASPDGDFWGDVSEPASAPSSYRSSSGSNGSPLPEGFGLSLPPASAEQLYRSLSAALFSTRPLSGLSRGTLRSRQSRRSTRSLGSASPSSSSGQGSPTEEDVFGFERRAVLAERDEVFLGTARELMDGTPEHTLRWAAAARPRSRAERPRSASSAMEVLGAEEVAANIGLPGSVREEARWHLRQALDEHAGRAQRESEQHSLLLFDWETRRQALPLDRGIIGEHETALSPTLDHSLMPGGRVIMLSEQLDDIAAGRGRPPAYQRSPSPMRQEIASAAAPAKIPWVKLVLTVNGNCSHAQPITAGLVVTEYVDSTDAATDIDSEIGAIQARPAAVHAPTLASFAEFDVSPIDQWVKQMVGGATAVNLQHYRLNPAAAASVAASLADTVTELELGHNALEDMGTAAIAGALDQNRSVVKLGLCNTGMQGVGMQHISQMLAINECLESLDLSCNDLRCKEIEVLCMGLGRNSVLSTLNLSRNRIGQPGASSMGRLLSSEGCALRHLELEWNEITGSGGELLARSIASNVSLSHLSLASNGLGHRGIVALAASLAANETLRHLDVAGAGFDRRGARALAEGLRGNKGLRFVDVSRNQLGQAGRACLWQSIKAHPELSAICMQGCGTLVQGEQKSALDDRVPYGSYRIELPEQRWLAVMLLERAQEHSARLENITSNGTALKSLRFTQLPARGVVEFDYLFKCPDKSMVCPPFKCSLDLDLQEHRRLAKAMKQRVLSRPYEHWRKCSHNGAPFVFRKQGDDSWKIPPTGVLNFEYLIQKLPDVDPENLDGVWSLNLGLPWDRHVAQLMADRLEPDKKVRTRGRIANVVCDGHSRPKPAGGKHKRKVEPTQAGGESYELLCEQLEITAAKAANPLAERLKANASGDEENRIQLSFEYADIARKPTHLACYELELPADAWVVTHLRLLLGRQRAGQAIRSVTHNGEEYEIKKLLKGVLPKAGWLKLSYATTDSKLVTSSHHKFELDDAEQLKSAQALFKVMRSSMEQSWDRIELRDGEGEEPELLSYTELLADDLVDGVWSPPEYGTLELDHVVLQLAATDAAAVSSRQLEQLLAVVGQASSHEESVDHIKAFSSAALLTAAQVFRVMQAFSSGRREVAQLLLPRAMLPHSLLNLLSSRPTKPLADAGVGSVRDAVGAFLGWATAPAAKPPEPPAKAAEPRQVEAPVPAAPVPAKARDARDLWSTVRGKQTTAVLKVTEERVRLSKAHSRSPYGAKQSQLDAFGAALAFTQHRGNERQPLAQRQRAASVGAAKALKPRQLSSRESASRSRAYGSSLQTRARVHVSGK